MGAGCKLKLAYRRWFKVGTRPGIVENYELSYQTAKRSWCWVKRSKCSIDFSYRSFGRQSQTHVLQNARYHHFSYKTKQWWSGMNRSNCKIDASFKRCWRCCTTGYIRISIDNHGKNHQQPSTRIQKCFESYNKIGSSISPKRHHCYQLLSASSIQSKCLFWLSFDYSYLTRFTWTSLQ